MKIFVTDRSAKPWQIPVVDGKPVVPEDAPPEVRGRVTGEVKPPKPAAMPKPPKVADAD